MVCCINSPINLFVFVEGHGVYSRFFISIVTLAYFQLLMGPIRSCFDFMVASMHSSIKQFYTINYHRKVKPIT